MSIKEGNLFWITGLAGAGKTTLGRELYTILKSERPHPVFLDGDRLRQLFGPEKGYSNEDRFSLAMQYAGLCKLLTDQGIDVICSTISMFEKCREWCRTNIPNYREIYLKVPREVLVRRDKKGLYSGVLEGTQVVGMDLDFEEPKTPDLVLDSSGSLTPRELAQRILEL
ncbi:MAG: adenylyl-sulfate kinase [Deltaproteobacteria bacterium]|nr:adenylyl-sulfate kinase [Deltaproteobacteria bacterium]